VQRVTSILVVEDDELLRSKLRQTLEDAGYSVTEVDSGESAVASIARDEPDLALVDLNLPGMSGIDLCARLRQEGRDIHLLVMTAFTSIPSAVEAIKAGAHDYLVKPLDMDGLLHRLGQASDTLRTHHELRMLKDAVRADRGQGGLLGACPPMRRLFDQLDEAAQTGANVLITGETGTGRRSFALELHRRGPNPEGPFVALNVSELPDARLQEQIFGSHEPDPANEGRATGGLIAQARGGTLFISEMCELPVSTQARLLRALEAERDATPEATIRVVAATNRSPEIEIEQENLRRDLFHHLNVLSLDLPPLRARRSDIPLLTENFLAVYSARFGKQVSEISAPALERLLTYEWPGNVRELQSCIERAVALCSKHTLDEEQLPAKIAEHSPVDLVVATADPNDWITLEEVSMLYTRHVLRGFRGNKSRAARVLGVDRKTLARKLRRWDSDDE
jgi:two-component system response regulator HydG